MVLQEYFATAHRIMDEIYAATTYTHVFYYQGFYFGYRPEPEADGNVDLRMIPMPEMLTLVLNALEKMGLADASMETPRIIELNLLYLGLLTIALPNNILSEGQFERLTDGKG